MKGYIIVEGKQQVVNDGTIHMTVSKAIDEAFRVKDNWWDCTARQTLKLYIVNLKNGKAIKLKGWQTNYTRFDRIDKESTDTHWYKGEQVKALERSLQ